MNDIVIGKVKNDGCCWGNMAPFPIEFDGKRWLTSEELWANFRMTWPQ